MIKKLLLCVVASLGSLFMAFSSFAATSGSATPLDSVVAVVNTSVITQSELNLATTDLKRQLSRNGTFTNDSEVRKQALDELIAQTLEVQIAERNNIQVTDAQVDELEAKIAQQNNLTQVQLKEALSKEGIGYNQFRKQLKNQAMLRELQQRIFAGKVKVSDNEVKHYLKNTPGKTNPNALYHLEDLIVPLSESASATEVRTAQQQAQDLLKQARAGNTFNELTNRTKQSSEIKSNDLGWRKIDQLPSLFIAPVQQLQVGDITSPIRAPNGLHLLKLIAAQGQALPLTETEVKNQIFQQKMKQQIDSWLQRVRKSAYIKIM